MGCNVMGLVCNMEYLQWKSVRHGVYGIVVVKHLKDLPEAPPTFFAIYIYSKCQSEATCCSIFLDDEEQQSTSSSHWQGGIKF